MTRRHFLHQAGALLAAPAALGSAVLGLSAGPAQAQAFPAKPVRVIVPFAAGNTLDTSRAGLASWPCRRCCNHRRTATRCC
jgi:hypothetical protein